jgi:hypothetical protein
LKQWHLSQRVFEQGIRSISLQAASATCESAS